MIRIYSSIVFLIFSFSPVQSFDGRLPLVKFKDGSHTLSKELKLENTLFRVGTGIYVKSGAILGATHDDDISIKYEGLEFYGLPGISFYKNRKFKFGVLAKDGVLDGKKFKANSPLSFNKNGKFEFLGGSYLNHNKQEWFPIKNCFQSNGISLDGPSDKNSRESSMPKFKLHWFTCTLRERTKHHGIYWPKNSIIHAKEFDNGVLHIHTAWIPPGNNFKDFKNEVGLEVEYCLVGNDFVMIGPWKQKNYDLFELDSDCNNRKGARFLKN